MTFVWLTLPCKTMCETKQNDQSPKCSEPYCFRIVGSLATAENSETDRETSRNDDPKPMSIRQAVTHMSAA